MKRYSSDRCLESFDRYRLRIHPKRLRQTGRFGLKKTRRVQAVGQGRIKLAGLTVKFRGLYRYISRPLGGLFP
jgi:hypothetical protein